MDSDFMTRLSQIPGTVLNNSAAFLGFAVADYAAAVVLSMIPRFGGAVGMLESAAVYGAVKVVDFATWDAFNRGHAEADLKNLVPTFIQDGYNNMGNKKA